MMDLLTRSACHFFFLKTGLLYIADADAQSEASHENDNEYCEDNNTCIAIKLCFHWSFMQAFQRFLKYIVNSIVMFPSLINLQELMILVCSGLELYLVSQCQLTALVCHER
jgi:hypothetical protein